MAAITSAGRASGFEPVEPVADSGAAAALYERHSSRVFGYCLSRLVRREDAEDAVQTTFLHAIRGLRRGIVPAVELAWLLGIARNVCLARWESVGRLSRLEAPCDPVQLDRVTAAPPGRLEELIGLDDALSQLPDQQRRAVLLRDWRGLSYDEIAAQLDVSHAAVETLIFRGRTALAALLDEEPQATRRRLHSFGGLGSLFSAVKTAFTSGAAATKIAMAAVATVALSGAGTVVGTTIDGGGTAPVQAPAARPSSALVSLAAVAPERRAGAGSSALRSPATRHNPTTRSAAPAVASDPRAAQQSVPDSSTPASATPAEGIPARMTSSSVEPNASPIVSPVHPVQVAAVPPTEALVPAMTGVVERTVETLLPNLPVEVPSLPLPPPVLPPAPVQVPDVPALVADLPVTVTLPPVEVTPPKLLP